jgi:hypothetical protein
MGDAILGMLSRESSAVLGPLITGTAHGAKKIILWFQFHVLKNIYII